MLKKLSFFAMALALVMFLGQHVQAQSKAPVTNKLLPPPDPCDGCGDGGGGGPPPPPPAWGEMIGGAAVPADNGRLLLWEGNNGTQDKVWADFMYAGYVHQTNLNAGGTWTLDGQNVHPNDEARSMTMQRAKAGEVIELYDSPSGSTGDDWCQVIIKQDFGLNDRYLLFSFEHSYEDAWVKVTYFPHNGLDGKVSFFKLY